MTSRQISFLLAGQSNMTGRAGWYPDSPVPSPTRTWSYRREDAIEHNLAGKNVNNKVFRLNSNNTLEIAEEPLHFDVDNKKCGIGPGLAFAHLLYKLLEKRKVDNLQINLIPCAAGHTSLIGDWQEGASSFERMICRAKADPITQIHGLLWSQGETEAMKSDTTTETHSTYLKKFIESTRNRLSQPHLRVFLINIPKGQKTSSQVREAIASVANEDEFITLIDSEDLEMGVDGVHLGTASMVELGQRIAKSAATYYE